MKMDKLIKNKTTESGIFTKSIPPKKDISEFGQNKPLTQICEELSSRGLPFILRGTQDNPIFLILKKTEHNNYQLSSQHFAWGLQYWAEPKNKNVSLAGTIYEYGFKGLVQSYEEKERVYSEEINGTAHLVQINATAKLKHGIEMYFEGNHKTDENSGL